MKKLLLALGLAAIATQVFAQSSGDLAFTSINADEDGWSMVSFVDVAAGTSVYFTDNEWSGSAFNTGESYHLWTTAAIAAGDVIRFSAVDSVTSLAASNGTLARQAVTLSSNFGIAAGGETIYAYLGTSATAPTTFLAAISTSTYGTAAGGFLSNTGLAVGTGAVQLTAGSDYAEYAGSRESQVDFAAYKPMVNSGANWSVQDNLDAATLVPNSISFSVTAVPEPETYAMLLAGLGLIGSSVRRRRA